MSRRNSSDAGFNAPPGRGLDPDRAGGSGDVRPQLELHFFRRSHWGKAAPARTTPARREAQRSRAGSVRPEHAPCIGKPPAALFRTSSESTRNSNLRLSSGGFSAQPDLQLIRHGVRRRPASARAASKAATTADWRGTVTFGVEVARFVVRESASLLLASSFGPGLPDAMPSILTDCT